jgi:hypothetical protein
MPDLGKIGFGLPPDERRRAQAQYLAKSIMPWLRDAMRSVRDGKVEWDHDAMDLAFATIDEMAPLIDAEDFEESNKLLLHGILSMVIRWRQSGTLTEKKMKITAAIADTFVELYGAIADTLHLQVDRSGE